MLARGALAVVVLGHDEPLDVLVFPSLREFRDARCAPIDVVSYIGFACGGVHGAYECVGGDVGQMALVFEPRACSGDSVRGAFSGYLVQDAEAFEVVGGKWGEGLEESETVGSR